MAKVKFLPFAVNVNVVLNLSIVKLTGNKLRRLNRSKKVSHVHFIHVPLTNQTIIMLTNQYRMCYYTNVCSFFRNQELKTHFFVLF